MLQEQVVLALEGDEMSAGNAGSELAAGLDWCHEIAARMHHESWHGYLREKIPDIHIAHDVVISGGAFWRGCFAL